MIVQQVLDALDSEMSMFEQGVPAGRKMITAVDDGNNGFDRGALLLDDKGQLIAVGLVNGHCTVKSRDEALTCNDAPDTVLTIFQPQGAKQADAEPLIGWSKQLPPLLAIWAKSDNPERRAAAQKIATIEYAATNPSQGAWTVAQLPSDFPEAMLAMLPQRAHLIGAGAHGVFTTPGMEGSPIEGDWTGLPDVLSMSSRSSFVPLLIMQMSSISISSMRRTPKSAATNENRWSRDTSVVVLTKSK